MRESYSIDYRYYELNHWWFKARREILRDLLCRKVGFQQGDNVLEVGVGPGINLSTLYPDNIHLFGVEPDADNAALALKRNTVPVKCGMLEDVPGLFPGKQFDLITLFDVLEHIEADLSALKLIYQLLTENGTAYVTVPAFQWLWGPQDDVNLHMRRYTKKALKEKALRAGFEIKYSSYFNSLLFPLIAPFRLVRRIGMKEGECSSDFKYNNRWVNFVFYQIFRMEKYFLRYGSFPFGLSLMMILKKR